MKRTVYRSVPSMLWSVLAAALAIFLIGDAVLRSGWGTAALLAPWVLLALWAVYVTVFATVVATDAAGIAVQNLLRRTLVPWQEVAEIELRYQLVVITRGGAVLTCWGGPATARPALRPARRGDDQPRVPAAARTLGRIRGDWQRALATGAGAGAVRRDWDRPALIALGVLAVWAAIAVVVVTAR